MADAGKVAILPRCLWSAETVYEPLDLVYYDNKSFVALKESVGVTPVDGDTWMLSLSGISQETIDAILNGTQQVGDSAKLGGKDASEYAEKTELSSRVLRNYRGATVEEITAVYDSLHSDAPNRSSYEADVSHSTSYDKLGGGTWYVHGYKYSEAYGWQIAICYDTQESSTSIRAIYKRSILNGVWSDWDHIGKGYLPLSGGKVSGNIEIVIDTPNQRIFRIKNSVKDIYLNVNASGEFGLYDNTLGQYVFSSAPDGTKTFNGTASGNLPLRGGELKGRVETLLTVHNSFEGETSNKVNIVYKLRNAILGLIGFKSDGTNKKPYVRFEGSSTEYELLHTGNKPTGTYTGNGSDTERTIATGGVGNRASVSTGNGMAILSQHGATIIPADGSTPFWSPDYTFADGVITLKGTHKVLNLDGGQYRYQVE